MPLPASLPLPPGVALARSAATLPMATESSGEWLYEPKWDGFRLRIVRDDDHTSLWSRQKKNLTAAFPELADAAAAAIPAGCVLDGETVIWADGRLDFDELQRRAGRSGRAAARLAHQVRASFVAFDLLAVADRDIRGHPLSVRRALLEELASTWAAPLSISPITSDRAVAEEWSQSMAAAGIEGIVAKAAADPYLAGERQWIKVKRRETIDVIAAAVIGPITHPEAVVVGLPIDGELRIVGRSHALTTRAAQHLATQLQPPVGAHPWPSTVSPGAFDRFNSGRDPVELTLIEPIVAEVSADLARARHTFRHGVKFLRLRPELAWEELAAGGGLG
jgi:ATP-dependent DNA ligase